MIDDGSLKGKELDEYLVDAAYTFFEKALTPYTDASIITEALADVYVAATSDDRRTAEGKQLFPKNETPINNFINGVSHVAMSMMPGSLDSLNRLLIDADAMPGSLDSASRFFVDPDAPGIGEMYFDRPPKVSAATGSIRYDKRAELAANLIGVRFSRLDPKDKMFYAASDFQNHGRADFSKKINFGDKPEDIEREQKRNLRSNYDAQQDLYLMYDSVKELVGDAETRKVMKKAGISDQAIARIAGNSYYDLDYARTRSEDLFTKVDGQPEEIQQLIRKLNGAQYQYRSTPLIPVDETGKKRQERLPRAKGGVVLNVPQVPVEPDERIDKMTGLPYNQQAGEAFTDEEDRVGLTRRIAVAKGGKVDKKKMACNKPKRTPNHPKKSHIVKACKDGKEKIIRFGQQGAKTAGKPKAGESKRMKAKRKSFKARHRKNIKRGNMSAAYWADKVKW